MVSVRSIRGRLRTKPALFSCLALILSAQDSVHVELDTLPQAIIQQRLEENPRTLATREAALIALFHNSGCEAAEEKVPGAAAPNLICVLPGETGSTIVVGGHFDFAGRGTGAVDDWSGAVLLPSLLQSLKIRPRHHRYVFVAFSGEERDLDGSRQYVKKLSLEERREIHAMINLECLGTSSPKVWASRADKQLLEAYVRAAHALKLQAAASNVDAVGDDDSHPFMNAKIPVLTIHSVTQQTLALLHGPRDTVRAINPDEYYAAYRLAATFLALLDSTLQ